jgi:ribosomal protein S18 acetylase RimI-like enzyme
MYALQSIGASDLPALYQLAERIWLPTFAPFFTEHELKSLYKGMYNDETLLDWMSKSGHALFFICAQATPADAIGYLAIETKKDGLKLDKIYVDPLLHGKGIGRWAMAQMEEIAAKHGLNKISLRVNRRNRQAIHFYEKCGFHIDEEVDYPAPNGFVYDDYLMSKTMS